MNRTSLDPSRSCRVRRIRVAGPFVALLILYSTTGPVVRPVQAASAEDRLLSITKTTIYGALLGGLLGLASALVVRNGYEDDAVRWGVAIGSFGGFAYGLAYSGRDELDDLSLHWEVRRLDPVPTSPSWGEGNAYRTAARLGVVPATVQNRPLKGAEVGNGGLEEKDVQEKDSGAETHTEPSRP